jgi:hypothetical protein
MNTYEPRRSMSGVDPPNSTSSSRALLADLVRPGQPALDPIAQRYGVHAVAVNDMYRSRSEDEAPVISTVNSSGDVHSFWEGQLVQPTWRDSFSEVFRFLAKVAVGVAVCALILVALTVASGSLAHWLHGVTSQPINGFNQVFNG